MSFETRKLTRQYTIHPSDSVTKVRLYYLYPYHFSDELIKDSASWRASLALVSISGVTPVPCQPCFFFRSWFHNNQKQLNPDPKTIVIQWIIELFIGIILVMSISLKFDVLHSEFQFNMYVIGLFLITNLIGFRGMLKSNSFLGVPENMVLAAQDLKEKYINTQLSS